jgi:peptidoglycan/LPS O-acetylase OafA/YrhL
LPGGFVGVDIFFVISGFLIGGLIAEGARAGTFLFADFYARRARRIFPALSLVLAATLVAGWWFLLPDEFAALGRHVVAGAGFVANLLLWREAGYFDIDSARKPLLHLWSLGVEEQFYLVWPLLAIGAAKLRIRLGALAAAVALISLAWSGYEAWRDLVADFFSPLTRFWELMVGALVAEATVARRTTPTRDATLGVIGLALIAASFAIVRADSRFPGFWALLPVAGAAAVIAAGPDAGPNRLILSRRPIVYVGLISYPLYLWHWPPLAFAKTLLIDGPMVRVAIIAGAVVAAAATYRYVERPIRFGGGEFRRSSGAMRAFASGGALAVVAALGAGSLWIAPRIGNSLLLAGLTEAHKSFEHMVIWREFRSPIDGKAFSMATIGDAGRPKALFVGDSHTIQYGPRIQQQIESGATPRAALFAIGWGCPPIPKLHEPARHDFCEGYVERAVAYAKSDPSVEAVVFAADWLGGIAPMDGSLSNFYFDEPDGAKTYVGADTPALRRSAEELAKAIADLRGAGKNVFVVLNIPTGGEVDPHRWLVAKKTAGFSHSLPSTRDYDASFYLERYAKFRDLFGPIVAAAGAEVIEPIRTLCHADRRCEINSPSGPIYWDDSHLSVGFARERASWIDAVMK